MSHSWTSSSTSSGTASPSERVLDFTGVRSVNTTRATMEEVFQEYKGRQDGIIKALTSGLNELLKESKDVQMNTPFLERKCLWGYPNGTWKIQAARYQGVDEVPQPQPLIPFGKQWDEWVSKMADLSDGWLKALAYYRSSHLSLQERKHLVEKISRKPSVKYDIHPKCPNALLDMNEVPLEFHPECLSRKPAPSFCMRSKCEFAGDGDDSEIDEWIQCNLCELWYHCKCCDLETDKVQKIQFYNCMNCLKEVTYIMVKPDGIQRGLVGEIICRFEKKGFVLKGLKIFQCPKELAQEHYKDLKNRPFFPKLISYITSGPVVCMVSRKLIGDTNPLQAEPGTIRGDLAVETGRNVVHGSDSPYNAKHEIALWFKESELAKWDSVKLPGSV